MPKEEQLNEAVQGLRHNDKQGNRDLGKYYGGMSSWNPFISLNIKFEACLLGPSVTLQPAESSNETKRGGWSEERSHVLNDTSTMRETAHFTPGTLEASL